MSTYYEQLKLSPAASEVEITAAIDERYNQWRHLASNPQHSAQAQQQLQLLEEMRNTLTDPAKRVVYDSAIGVRGTVGGLADPSQLFQGTQPRPAPAPAPPSAQWACGKCGMPNSATARFCSKCGTQRQDAPRSAAAAPASTSLWACYKCSADNPPQTKFCFKCGAQLVQTCPECNKETSLIATKMCGSCGYNYDVATKRGQLRGQIDRLERQLTNTRTEKDQEATRAGNEIGCGSFILVSIAAMFGWFLTGSLVASMGETLGQISSGMALIGGITAAVLVSLAIFLSEQRRRGRHRRKAETLAQEIGQLEQQLGQANQAMSTTHLVRR